MYWERWSEANLKSKSATPTCKNNILKKRGIKSSLKQKSKSNQQPLGQLVLGPLCRAFNSERTRDQIQCPSKVRALGGFERCSTHAHIPDLPLNGCAYRLFVKKRNQNPDYLTPEFKKCFKNYSAQHFNCEMIGITKEKKYHWVPLLSKLGNSSPSTNDRFLYHLCVLSLLH